MHQRYALVSKETTKVKKVPYMKREEKAHILKAEKRVNQAGVSFRKHLELTGRCSVDD
jgi:hypothetical protein